MSIKHFNPYIRVAKYDIQDTYFCFDRTIWDYELIYIESGSMKVTYGDEKYIANPGDIVFLRPRVHHILESNSDVVYQPHIHFDFFEDEKSRQIFVPFVNEDKMTVEQKNWFRKDILPDMNIDLPPVIRLSNYLTIKNLLYKLIDEYTYNRAYSELMLESLFTNLFVELVREYTASTNENVHILHRNDLDKIMKYINENCEKKITIDELAEVSNISKFYLTRLFKMEFGIAPYQYITIIRIKKASDLIQFTDLSLKEIAYKMNFPDQQSFSRWFKKNNGYSPKKYRINKTLS